MSRKPLKQFKKHLDDGCRFLRLWVNHTVGERVDPPNTPKWNERIGLRLDAGGVRDGFNIFHLQVNREAKKSALKSFIRKNGTHADVAILKVRTDTPDDQKEAEFDKAWEEVEEQYGEKIG